MLCMSCLSKHIQNVIRFLSLYRREQFEVVCPITFCRYIYKKNVFKLKTHPSQTSVNLAKCYHFKPV